MGVKMGFSHPFALNKHVTGITILQVHSTAMAVPHFG